MNKLFTPIYAFFGLLCLSTYCNGENKTILLKNMFENYNNQVSPQEHNNPLDLSLGLALRAFKNIDQMEGTISANIWLRYKWNDPRFKIKWPIKNPILSKRDTSARYL